MILPYYVVLALCTWLPVCNTIPPKYASTASVAKVLGRHRRHAAAADCSADHTLTTKAENALRMLNARSLARLTGRGIAEEYGNPSYDLVHEIHKTRAGWLGHILRMDEISINYDGFD